MEPCDPRIYMAAERTFLAWIRTGLALMGFGFIAARLGLLLTDEPVAASSLEGPGVLPGVGLIILGVLVNVAAAFRHHRYLRALDRGEFRAAFGATFAFMLAGLLAILGLGLALYLCCM